jgi:hypothetical protein
LLRLLLLLALLADLLSRLKPSSAADALDNAPPPPIAGELRDMPLISNLVFSANSWLTEPTRGKPSPSTAAPPSTVVVFWASSTAAFATCSVTAGKARSIEEFFSGFRYESADNGSNQESCKDTSHNTYWDTEEKAWFTLGSSYNDRIRLQISYTLSILSVINCHHGNSEGNGKCRYLALMYIAAHANSWEVYRKLRSRRRLSLR